MSAIVVIPGVLAGLMFGLAIKQTGSVPRGRLALCGVLLLAVTVAVLAVRPS